METPVYTVKTCTSCEVSKPHTSFHKLSTVDSLGANYRRNVCKECVASQLKTGKPTKIKPVSKVCSNCSIQKSIENYNTNKNTKDGFRNQCKKCDFKVKKQREKLHPEYKARRKRSDLLWRYGLTFETYSKVLECQSNKCAICSVGLVNPQIDHCHTTNLVRGILCVNCNLLLGNSKDNIQILQSAIIYLKRFTND